MKKIILTMILVFVVGGMAWAGDQPPGRSSGGGYNLYLETAGGCGRTADVSVGVKYKLTDSASVLQGLGDQTSSIGSSYSYKVLPGYIPYGFGEISALNYDNVPPEIPEVKANGTRIYSGDAVGATPKIEAKITDNVHIYSVNLYMDGANREYTTVSAVPREWNISYEDSSRPFADGTNHRVTIVATDTGGNSTSFEAGSLTVKSGEAGIVGNPLNFPNPFKPSSGQGTAIGYNLTADTDIDLLIYTVGAQLVWRRHFAAGTEGGKLGYNEVAFNGQNDFGEYLANDIYVYKIVSGKRYLGGGRLTVYE